MLHVTPLPPPTKKKKFQRGRGEGLRQNNVLTFNMGRSAAKEQQVCPGGNICSKTRKKQSIYHRSEVHKHKLGINEMTHENICP